MITDALQLGIISQKIHSTPVLPNNTIWAQISFDDGSGLFYIDINSTYDVTSDVTVVYNVSYTYNSVPGSIQITKTISATESNAQYWFGAGYSVNGISLVSGSPAQDSTYKYIYN